MREDQPFFYSLLTPQLTATLRRLHRRRVPPSVLAWNDRTVLRLAESIHRSRRLSDLPILADALEEAGWNEPGILSLLRTNPEDHCWILFLLLQPGIFWKVWRVRQSPDWPPRRIGRPISRSPVGKLKAEKDGRPFEAELDGRLRWRTGVPHLDVWLQFTFQPETYDGLIRLIGLQLLLQAAEELKGECEFYPAPKEK